jgi:hypothetical protein
MKATHTKLAADNSSIAPEVVAFKMSGTPLKVHDCTTFG